jgi:hypothetical protein
MFLQVSIERGVEASKRLISLHSLGNIVRAPDIARSAMLIAAYIHEPGDHIIVRTAWTTDGDLKGLVGGMGVVHHIHF